MGIKADNPEVSIKKTFANVVFKKMMNRNFRLGFRSTGHFTFNPL